MSPPTNNVNATEHERYREDLSAYLDRQLGPARMVEVEAHLMACEACREELASLEQMVLWLRQLPPVRPPRSFLIPVAKPAPRRATTLGWAYGYLRLATALAMALLVLVVSGDLFLQFGLGPQSVAPLPAPAVMRPTEFGVKAMPTEPSGLTLGLAGEEEVSEPTPAPAPDTTLRVAYAPVESPSPQSLDAGAKALTPEEPGIGEVVEYTPTYAVVARESPEQPTPEAGPTLTSEGQRGRPPSVAPQPTPEPTATPEPTLAPQPSPTSLAVAMERGAAPVPTLPPSAHEYALVQYDDAITPLLRIVEVVLLVLVVGLVGLTWWVRRSQA